MGMFAISGEPNKGKTALGKTALSLASNTQFLFSYKVRFLIICCVPMFHPTYLSASQNFRIIIQNSKNKGVNNLTSLNALVFSLRFQLFRIILLFLNFLKS